MSRRYCAVEHPRGRLELVMGYDRPLRMLFLEVHPLDAEGAVECPACGYDSLERSELDWTQLATLCGELRRMGLRPPAEMLLAVWSDQRRHAGNLIARHRPGQPPEILRQG